jgi:hypothetical protein
MNATKIFHASVRSIESQTKQFLSRFVQNGVDALSGLFKPGQLEDLIKEYSPTSRNRLYSPLTTIGMFLDQVFSADHSCQDAVVQELSNRVAQDLSESSLNTGPYCKARKRLSSTLLSALCQTVADNLLQSQSNLWRWRGRDIKIVDGVTILMPDTALNQATYPQSNQQKDGQGFPIMRIVAIISLGCGTVLEWVKGACCGKLTGETSMFRQLGDSLKSGDILLSDRCYAGYFTVAGLMAKGVDFVCRQHQRRKTDFEQGRRLGKRDHIAIWLRPIRPKWMTPEDYEKVPVSLEVRETQVGGWTLITSMKDEKHVTPLELNELYGWRWHIELDLRAIKSVLQMEMMRCKTPDMVAKEVAVHFLGYNLVRSAMAQAANKANCMPRELSFKSALQLLRAFAVQLCCGINDRINMLCDVLIRSIGKKKLLHRPGRVEPRAVKRRPKGHVFLTQPRAVLKAKLQVQRDLIMVGVLA